MTEDNNYFYNILAHSYILGVNYKWTNNFKDKAIIVYDDMVNFNYLSYSFLRKNDRNIYTSSED